MDTVSHIERGVNATRIEVAYLIAGELGVRLRDLFAFEGEPDRSERRLGSKVAETLAELLDGCDEDTATALLDLMRAGLKLTGRRVAEG